MKMEAHVQENKARALIADIYDVVGSNRRYWLEFARLADKVHLPERNFVKLSLGKMWAKSTQSERKEEGDACSKCPAGCAAKELNFILSAILDEQEHRRHREVMTTSCIYCSEYKSLAQQWPLWPFILADGGARLHHPG
jgi:hypothetical protein